VLQLFGAGAFVPARASDYDRIEEIGRELGLVS
jgi:phosphonate transport system substrate-binding protein